MKKYIRPIVTFVKAGIAERIAAACWGDQGVLTQDSLKILYTPTSTEHTFTETQYGDWGTCTSNAIPATLEGAIRNVFGINSKTNLPGGFGAETAKGLNGTLNIMPSIDS